MSLINDALKRAAEAEKRQTGTRRSRRGPKGAEALGPMVHAQPVKPGRDVLSISPAFGLIMVIILMGGLSSFLLHGWWSKRRPFKPKIPPGMDALEVMIKPDPRRSGKRSGGPIIVNEKGIKSDTPTNTVATATTNDLATATTNTVSTPPAAEVVQNTVTNPVPAPTTISNQLPSGPLVTKVEPPVTQPQPPPIPSTNAPSRPVKLPEPEPIVTGPVIVRPRSVEGGKATAEVKADLATREREAMLASTNGPIKKTRSARVEKAPIEFPEIAVRAIIIKQGSGSADVNGKIVSLGDFIGGAELVEVRNEYLVFAWKNEQRKFYIAQ